jgi:hypothetical protein
VATPAKLTYSLFNFIICYKDNLTS